MAESDGAALNAANTPLYSDDRRAEFPPGTTSLEIALTDALNVYHDALARIVAADDAKQRAWESGQHSSITRWIPTEEAIEAARELLRRG